MDTGSTSSPRAILSARSSCSFVNWRGPISGKSTITACRRGRIWITRPSPMGVMTLRLRLGRVLMASTYWSYSYIKQQRSRPHMPVISEGVSEISWVFAMRIEIEENSVRNFEQQRFSSPQAPMPRISLAVSRGPICRSSR